MPTKEAAERMKKRIEEEKVKQQRIENDLRTDAKHSIELDKKYNRNDTGLYINHTRERIRSLELELSHEQLKLKIYTEEYRGLSSTLIK